MRNYVEGESEDHFKSYYGFARNHVQDKIYSLEKNVLLNSDIDHLTELVVQDYVLPLVKIDSSTKPQVEDKTGVGRWQMYLKIKIPLILEEKIDTVIGFSCNPPKHWGVDYALENGFLITEEWYDVGKVKERVENAINELKTMLQYKNDQIPRENDSLREYAKNFLEKTIQRLQQNKKGLDELESLPIDLVKKEEEHIIPNSKIKKKIVEQFKLSALERLARIVGDYFTGSDITELFKKSGYPDINHDGGTKWKFLYSTFEELQEKKSEPSIILKFLETVCDPQEFFGRPELHESMLSKINEVLGFYGFQINEKGKVIKIKEKQNTIITTQTKDKSRIFHDNNQWDVFISHASEDKEDVAKPFAEKLQSLNLKVWYDEFTLKWGGSLRKSIDEGLSNSLFGIVVLSKVFFQKEWTKIELDGLTTMMITRGKGNILPLRYKISHEEVAKVSPTLAGLFSRSWDEGIDKLANEVKKLVEEKKDQSRSKF